MKLSEVIALYIEKRDEKAEITAQYKKDIEKIDTLLKKIENKLLEVFNKTGQTSAKVDGVGVAFMKQRTSDKVIDRKAYLQFVIDNEAYDFLESRVSKAALDQYIEDHEDLPPGVTRTVETIVNIRRS